MNDSPRIHITAMEVPVAYKAVLSIVPTLHAPPSTGYDFVMHVGVAGSGPLRLEELGHKFGYYLKDVDGQLAPIVSHHRKDCQCGPISEMDLLEKERLQAEDDSDDTPIDRCPVRGFGKGYESFPEELTTSLDLPCLMESVKRAGTKVFSFTIFTRTAQMTHSTFSRKSASPTTLVIISVTSFITVHSPKPSAVLQPARLPKFCFCIAHQSMTL